MPEASAKPPTVVTSDLIHIPQTADTGATRVFYGKLQLGLTCRPACFWDDTASGFLDLYVEEIRNYMLATEAAVILAPAP